MNSSPNVPIQSKSASKADRSTDPLTEGVWEAIEPWLAAEQVELDDVEMIGSGKGRTLRILIDHADGIDLDRIAAISDGLSRLLEDQPALADPYQLEVSSPGLERKLRRRRQWQKAVGSDVSVKVREGSGNRTLKGRLVEVADRKAIVELADGTPAETTVEFDLETVVTAKTVFRWEKTPKPGKR